MIFYGTRATHIKNGQIRNVICPNCETQTTMNFSVFGQYGHVYWIPLFPARKIVAIECNNCKKSFTLKEVTPQIRERYVTDRKLDKVNFPLWMFSGSFVIAAGICVGIYFSSENAKDELTYINNPKAGDFYHIKLDPSTNDSSNHYTILRVDRVTKDSIFTTLNDYETNLQNGIEEIDVPKNYTVEKENFSKKDVIEMHKKGTIYEVDRK